MTFATVCSGIGAPECAWKLLGWKSAWASEIEPFPAAVLDHHYPETPNLGDMTKFKGWKNAGTIDLLCGGTPCQSFSVAGLRGGLNDPRGNLMLVFGALANHFQPRWLLWENVPGVLSSNGGRDFGSFLGMLATIGYGFAYRILDAQYFGLAQRRKRVFVVGYLGDWRRAAAVLFESESLCWYPPPSRETGKDVAPKVSGGPPFSRTGNERVEADAMVITGTLSARNKGGGGLGTDFDLAGGLTARYGKGTDSDASDASDALVTHSLRGEGFDASEDGTGRGTPVIPINTQVALRSKKLGEATGLGIGVDGDPAYTLQSAHHHAVAFAQNTRDEVREMKVAGALAAEPGAKQQSYLRQGMAVRRLTPGECERLQGFPDDYTRINWRGRKSFEAQLKKSGKRLREPSPKEIPDGPRYKALGNSMAVPVISWLGRRIEAVDKIK